jgi:redox-sensing transcriptional repressor
LQQEIKRILQTDREIRVALFGAGNLGHALLSYAGFVKHGFSIVAAFDISPSVIGQRINGVEIEPLESAPKRLLERRVNIAMLAMGAETCQATVDTIARAGITAILNFVPRRLVAPENIEIHYVDLAVELEILSYYLRD